MIVPSISILLLSTLASASANFPDTRIHKRQIVNATPAQALSASVFANAAIAQVIIAIIQQAAAAAAAISAASAASVRKTATTASPVTPTTATTGTTVTTTSSSSAPGPTCYDTSANSNQLPTLTQGPATCAGVCGGLQAATAACVNNYTTQSAFLACICSTQVINLAFACGACDDSATTPNTGFYSLRATTFCNQCLALSLGVTSCGVQPAVLSLPACPVVVSSSTSPSPTTPAPVVSSSSSSTTSSAFPAPTCFDNSVNANQIPTVLGASSGTCSPSCAQFVTSSNSCSNNFSGAGYVSCVCQSFNLNAMVQCAGCEDSVSSFGPNYYTNRAVSLCNQCISVGYQAAGACPASPVNSLSLPACSVTRSSSSTSTTAPTNSSTAPQPTNSSTPSQSGSRSSSSSNSATPSSSARR